MKKRIAALMRMALLCLIITTTFSTTGFGIDPPDNTKQIPETVRKRPNIGKWQPGGVNTAGTLKFIINDTLIYIRDVH